MEGTVRFHWADYLVFGLCLLLSAAVGVFYAWLDRKKNNPEEFLMAGRNMPALPVSFSLFVTWMSAISILGDPVEVYYHGALYVVMGLGYTCSLPLIAYVVAPHFFRLRVTSAFQYLEYRYHFGLRILGSIANILGLMMFLGIVLYGPSLALSQVSGLPVWVSMVTVGAVCTFYTTLGGMKAVLWADTFQAFVMFGGLAAILIQGCITLGGPVAIWKSAQDGGRINFNRFSPNPLVRSTVWTYFIGGFFRVIKPYTASQSFIQRFCTSRTLAEMKLAVMLNIPMYLLAVSMFGAVGVIMYVHFKHCDPLLRGVIAKKDQLLPQLMMELLGHLPGVPGLFLACIFSASLSSLSSGINGVAALVLSDFAQPLYKQRTKRVMPDLAASRFAKSVSLVLGMATIGLGFLIQLAGNSHIFTMAIYVTGIFNGPLSGVFMCGILFPFVKTLHIVLGVVVSLAISIWLSLGRLFNPGPSQALPTSAACDVTHFPYNHTGWETSTSWMDHSEETTHRPSESSLYSFSPVLFMGVAPTLCILTALGAVAIHKLISAVLAVCGVPEYTMVKKQEGQQQPMEIQMDNSSKQFHKDDSV